MAGRTTAKNRFSHRRPSTQSDTGTLKTRAELLESPSGPGEFILKNHFNREFLYALRDQIPPAGRFHDEQWYIEIQYRAKVEMLCMTHFDEVISFGKRIKPVTPAVQIAIQGVALILDLLKLLPPTARVEALQSLHRATVKEWHPDTTKHSLAEALENTARIGDVWKNLQEIIVKL